MLCNLLSAPHHYLYLYLAYWGHWWDLTSGTQGFGPRV
jgi:hypothetical protein